MEKDMNVHGFHQAFAAGGVHGLDDPSAAVASAQQPALIQMTGDNYSNYQIGGRRYKIDGDGVLREFYSGVAGAAVDDVPALLNLGCEKA